MRNTVLSKSPKEGGGEKPGHKWAILLKAGNSKVHALAAKGKAAQAST